MPRGPNRTSWTKRPAGAGKPKGATSRKTKEIKEFFETFFKSQQYRDNLKLRILRGKAQQIETLGYYYVCGKPKERVQIDDPNGLLGDHESLISALTARIVGIATARSSTARTPTDVTPGTPSDLLLVEGTSEAEPIAAGGVVDDVADPVWKRLGEDTHGSGDDQDMGQSGDQATGSSGSHTG